MRTFIAVCLPPEVKKALAAAQDAMRAAGAKGNFTRAENLHLTLVFLGEVEPARLAAVRSAMDGVERAAFDAVLDRLGRFSRPGGDIQWAGLAPNAALDALQLDLTQKLAAEGFALETRTFTPHLTLARELRLPPDFAYALPKLPIPVRKLSLMESRRMDGRLVYTERYVRRLSE